MKTLEEKTFKISELLVYNTKKDKVLHYEDVKDSLTKFEKEIHELNIKYPEGIPVLELMSKLKEIVGEFEE